MCFRRQFVWNMWPLQFAFLHFVVCRMFLSTLIICNTSSCFTRLAELIFSILIEHHISKLSVFLIYFPKCLSFSTIQSYAPIVAIHLFILNLSPICWWKGSSSCGMLLIPWQSWIWFHTYFLHHFLSGYPNSTFSSCFNCMIGFLILMWSFMFTEFQI